jgi:hypothetical protein
MSFNTDKAYKYLIDRFGYKKLSRMGVMQKRGNYVNYHHVDDLYTSICADENDLVNQENAFYVLRRVANSPSSDKRVELAAYILDNFEIEEKIKEKLFLRAASFDESDSFYPKGPDVADVFFDRYSHEEIFRIADDSKRYDAMWTNHSEEQIMYYFYKKGILNFKYDAWKKQNALDSLVYCSLGLWRRVDFRPTNKFIESVLYNYGRKDFERRVEYLFTIPEFRKKVVDNPKWMFYKVGWGKFIDYYPEEYQKEFKNKLIEEYKKERSING